MKATNVNNKEKIVKEIISIEAKAQVRLLGGYERITTAIENTEKKLKTLGIPKKYWIGCNIYLEPECVANSYNYKAEGTAARIERKKSAWFVISIHRTSCKKIAHGSYAYDELYLSKLAHENLPNKYTI